MKSRLRRFRATMYYLRTPCRQFLPTLLTFIAALFLGGWYIASHYPERAGLGYGEALMLTYSLILAQPMDPLPHDAGMRVLFFVLPLLGLVIVVDGIVKFSYHLLRKDETSREWVHAMALTLKDHVVLCGLGKLGLRVLQQLNSLQELVIVLERDPACRNLLYARNNEIPVLIGNGRDEGILDEVNITQARSIILATSDDLANLEIALDARKANPRIRVVLRMFDQELASKIRGAFDIQLAFSTSGLAAPLFATCSTDRSILNAFYVGERLLVIASLVVQPASALAGKTLEAVMADHVAFVLQHQRCGSTLVSFSPSQDVELRAGDRIVVQAEPATLQALHELNLDPKPY